MVYGPDIDGLWVIAVLSVIVFHATRLLPGGFVGLISYPLSLWRWPLLAFFLAWLTCQLIEVAHSCWEENER